VASQNRRLMASCAAAGWGQTSQTASAGGIGRAAGEGVDVGAVMAATACLRRGATGSGVSDPAPMSEGCTWRTDTPHATPGAAAPGRLRRRPTTRKDP
jgi:hypothetical protein